MQYWTQFLSWIMNGCYSLTGNYGWAIILFTLVTKIIILPITIWTYMNSIKMVKIQPEMNEIKVKYYGQADEISEKTAELQKKNGYHPLLSTIPLIVQVFLLMGVVEVIKAGIGDPSIDMNFGPINLAEIPSENGLRLIWAPIIAGFASWILCIVQDHSDVLQSEQGKGNKIGTMLFSVGLSVYLGWFVFLGTVVYWICSNLFAVVQLYLFNAIVKPRRFVDYERLEKSRQELASIQSAGKNKGDHYFSENRRRERADYKKFFKVVNKHLVFYSESNGFYKYYKGFIEYILKHTNITIHYITSDPNDNIFRLAEANPRIRAYYIGENKLITLMMKMDADIVCMTMPDLETYHIKRSYIRKDIEYVYIPHGMGSNNLLMRKFSTAHFDTVFCTGSVQLQEEDETDKTYNLKPRKLVKVGYPLIDEMRAEYDSSEHKPNKRKRILIAPSWQKDNIVDSCLETLIDQLKSKDYDIIVRPHPQEVRLKQEYMNALVEKYKDYNNVKIQTDFSSNSTVMEADLLITDWSDISWEFCFTTRRPVLFINTPMKIMNPEWEKIGVMPLNLQLRDKIGKSLNLDELDKTADTVEEMLSNTDMYHERIETLAKENLYNLGSSAEIGACYLISSLQEKVRQREENKAAD